MAKLSLIDWPSTVLVAAPSLKDFGNICEKYARKYPLITFGWWLVIPGSYWVSGLANPNDLNRLFAELTSKVHEKELPVLIDLELPIKKYLYFKNLFRIHTNKKRISKFFAEAPRYNLKVYAAEYPALNRLLCRFWHLLGISPSFSFQHTKLLMCYSSMGLKYFGAKIWNRVKKFEKKFALTNSGRVGFGLGTIATGILRNEPIFLPEQFAQDIEWANECGVKEVFIFRLGGMSDSYLSFIKEFITRN